MNRGFEPPIISLDTTPMQKRHITIRVVGALSFVALVGFTGAAHRSSRGALRAVTAIDGPFRDGLFVGRLSAEECRPRSASVGRWSDAAARTRFAVGYDSAYSLIARQAVACARRAT